MDGGTHGVRPTPVAAAPAVAANRVREPGGAAGLRVVAAHAALRPIQITGLDAVLRLYETAEEALAG